MSSLNLKLLRGYKNVYNVLKPQYNQHGLIGKSSFMAKNKILFESSRAAALAQTTQQQRLASTQAAPVSHAASLHWTVERVLATGMLVLIPASIVLETAPTDYLLATALVLHAHWGLQSIVTDYIHGKTLPKMAHLVLYGVSILAFAGLCYFNYNDIGLSKAIKKLWKL